MAKDEDVRRRFALLQYDVFENGPEEEFEQLVDLVCLLFSTPIAAITLLDGDVQRIKAHRGMSGQDDDLDHRFLNQILDSRGPLIIEDARHDVRFTQNPSVAGPQGYRSFLGVALCTPDGTQIGTICVIDTVARHFSDIDGEIIERIAKIAVADLELRLIGSKDAASGAESRRAFLDVLGRELERHKRSGTQSMLLVCHLTGLSHLPGADGTQTANAAIAAYADQIRQFMRKTDTLGRVGYGSLGLLLADVRPDEADAALNRIRQAVKTVQDETITALFGYVHVSDRFTSGSVWLAAADQAARTHTTSKPAPDRTSTTHRGIGQRWMN